MPSSILGDAACCALDALAYPRCGGGLRLIAIVHKPAPQESVETERHHAAMRTTVCCCSGQLSAPTVVVEIRVFW